MVDTDMYQGPILLIYGEMQQQVEQQVEKLVLEEVQKVGVYMDKDELLKALAYDRGQYEKGRADALATIVRCNLTPFDVLEIISSSYAGKQIFFQEKNGTIYDRYNGEHITLEEAVDRMAKLVGDDGSV